MEQLAALFGTATMTQKYALVNFMLYVIGAHQQQNNNINYSVDEIEKVTDLITYFCASLDINMLEALEHKVGLTEMYKELRAMSEEAKLLIVLVCPPCYPAGKMVNGVSFPEYMFCLITATDEEFAARKVGAI